MSCPSFEEKIARYVGGDLAAPEVRTVEEHLRHCAACAELARLLEQDRAWLHSRPPETAAVDYAAMRNDIRRTIVQQRNTRRWAWVLAAAVVLLAFGIGMMRRSPVRTMPVAMVRPAAELPASRPTVTASVSVVHHASAGVPTRHARLRAPRNSPKPITLEDAMRMMAELDQPAPVPAGSDSPVEMRIATSNPHVTIVLLQETQGDSYE